MQAPALGAARSGLFKGHVFERALKELDDE